MVSDPPELELQACVTHHVGTEEYTRVLWKAARAEASR